MTQSILEFNVGGLLATPDGLQAAAWAGAAYHVAFIGGANEPFALHLNFLGDFVGSQAALLSPIVFILAIWAWIRVIRKKSKVTPKVKTNFR